MVYEYIIMGFSKGSWICGQLVLFTMETMAIELVICFSPFCLGSSLRGGQLRVSDNWGKGWAMFDSILI